MNVRGGVASTSPLGLQTETVRDAMERADSVSKPSSYSGVMLHNKDLRRVVLMVNEYRALTSELTAAKEELAYQKNSLRAAVLADSQEEAKVWKDRAEAAETALTSARKETERLREENIALRERVKRMEEALHPFAKAAEVASVPGSLPPEKVVLWCQQSSTDGVTGAITVADCRAAKAALKKGE